MINDLIKLQSLEKKCLDIEKQINSSTDKKEAKQAVNDYKMATEKTAELDLEAKKLLDELVKLQAVQEKGVSIVEKYTNQNSQSLSQEELIDLKAKIDKTNASLAELEKRLYAFSDRVKKVLVQSEEMRKTAIAAKKSHQQAKENFTKSVDEVSSDLKQYKAQITEISSKIDDKWLKKYKAIRAENIFPVVVPCASTRCGGCRMELPSLALEKLKANKHLDCPSCHRIIYLKEEK